MKRISENEAERKRLGGIERKRKRRAWTLPLFRRTLAVTLCAAMIAGFSLELIPANAEETGKVTEGTSAPEGNDNQGNIGDQGNGGNGSTESVAANLPATTTTSAVTTEAAKETGTVTTTQTKAAETVTTTETATETTTETTTETAKAKSENEIKVEAKCVDTDGKDIDGQNPIQIQDSIEFNSDNVPKIDGYTYEKAQIKYNDNDTVITKINVTEYFAPSAPSIRFIAPPIRATAPCSM